MNPLTLEQPRESRGSLARRLLSDYGMALVLLLLVGFFSVLTISDQYRTGESAAEEVLSRLDARPGGGIVVVAHDGQDAEKFVEAARRLLDARQIKPLAVSLGTPGDFRDAMEKLESSGQKVTAILATYQASRWPAMEKLAARFPIAAGAPVISPRVDRRPNFLTATSLASIGDRIVVIAIIAIGMTMVIITGGIDLSVGSLIAFGAVLSAWLIRAYAGAEQAAAGGIILCCVVAIAVCAASGLFNGAMVTLFGIPPFIVTLAMMLEFQGWARKLAKGQAIHQVPASIAWLGRGKTWGIDHTILLMVLLYIIAQVIMNRTLLGRYIYAIGGNKRAAYLSGVPVKRVIVAVYAICAALAGLGGVIEASRLQTGDPNFGQMAELSVIAAVVVGGTSLSGGRGKIFGTLIGALIIAVMESGMNQVGVESYDQKVIMGAVILGAVLLDKLKNPGRMKEWQT